MPRKARASARAAAPLAVDQTKLVAVELSAVVAAAVERLRPEAAARRLRLLSSLDRSCRVWGDTERLAKAAIAMLSRAFDTTPDGGSIVVTLSCDETRATLRVAAQDEGIEAAKLSQFFDPFGADPPAISGRLVRRSSGLGLALARDTVLKLGGAVSVESSGSGEGTTFSIQLPILG